ncbi:hypothetical protein NDU88_001673 [Pleurodeles waltl]|uniref:Uncharacterized protein n=1 Tax=Pleurodeles waltl TaxID=8319 RepID=A0AAV7WMN5_PLEWA|nr:hypothetical protein NDU88_001673 [Pleurodeles waltl]
MEARGEDPDIKNLLLHMRKSLTSIESMTDRLTARARVDKISSKLDKNEQRISYVEARISALEDDSLGLSARLLDMAKIYEHQEHGEAC